MEALTEREGIFTFINVKKFVPEEVAITLNMTDLAQGRSLCVHGIWDNAISILPGLQK